MGTRSFHDRPVYGWAFLAVPAIWFHTGLHPDYHTVNDRPEKINYVKMETIARLVHQVLGETTAEEGPEQRLCRARTTRCARHRTSSGGMLGLVAGGASKASTS